MSTAGITDDEFDRLFDKCGPISDKIEKLQPHFEKYKNSKITYAELKQVVHPQSKSSKELPKSTSSQHLSS